MTTFGRSCSHDPRRGTLLSVAVSLSQSDQCLLSALVDVHALTVNKYSTAPGSPNGTAPGDLNNAYSPPYYPSPWVDSSAAGWTDAVAKAQAFVSQLTLLEKVNLTTGVGWEGEAW
jgi:hypothetical protein